MLPASLALKRSTEPNERRSAVRTRVIAVFVTIVYIGLLWWSYARIIAPVWSYLGFSYARPPILSLVASLIFAIAPIAVLPMVCDRPSRWVIQFLYIGVYVPACFLPVFQRSAFNRPRGPYFELLVALCAAMFLMSLFDHLPRVTIPRLAIPKQLYWGVVLFLWGAMHLLILIKFRGRLSLSTQKTIGLQRSALADVVGTSRLVGYAITLALSSLDPLLFAVGLVRRNWLLLMAGALGELVIFEASAARGSVAIVLVTALVVFLTRRGRSVTLLSLARALAVAILVLMSVYAVSDSRTRLNTEWVLYRTLMTSSASIEHYFDFFQTHNKAGVSQMITGHKYEGQPIGDIIGTWRTGQPGVQENANFLADGYGGDGTTGVFIESMLAIMVLWAFDSMTGRVDRRLVIAVVAAQSVNFANLPLSITVLGGGLALTMVLLWLLPSEPPKSVRAVSETPATLA